MTGAAADERYADLVRDVGPSLRRLAHARTGSWAAAEDVVQDVLSDAHRRWDVIGAYDLPEAWARRAVLNRSASWHRSRGREHRALERVASRAAVAPSPGEPRLVDDELWTAIRSLSDRTPEQLDADTMRANELQIQGNVVLQVTARRLRDSPQSAVEVVAAALARAATGAPRF